MSEDTRTGIIEVKVLGFGVKCGLTMPKGLWKKAKSTVHKSAKRLADKTK